MNIWHEPEILFFSQHIPLLQPRLGAQALLFLSLIKVSVVR